MTMRKLFFYVAIFFLAIPVSAQMRLVPDAQGSKVFVWLDHAPRLGEQYHVYRKIGEASFEKLTDTPITGVTSGEELVAQLGEAFQYLRRQMDESEPQAVYLRLRADRFRAKLYAYALPPLGKALGQLYVDENAPSGEAVTYKIEMVDGAGKPRGKAMTGTVLVRPEIPAAPQSLTASHEGLSVTFRWSYPKSDDEIRDQVVRFDIMKQMENGKFVPIQEAWLLRDANQSQHTYLFTALKSGESERYHVVAVNVAGTSSAGSNVFNLKLDDNKAPEVLEKVRVVVSPKGNEATITFPMSTDAQLAGYHVYRSLEIEKNFVRINEKTLGPLETVYKDKTILPGKTYYYRISVVDAAGNESAQSNAVMAESLDKTPPPPPKNLKASLTTDRKINLAWQIPPTTDDLLAYVLLRRQVKNPPELFTQLTTRTFVGDQFVDDGLAQGQLSEGVTYEYVVTAMDKKQNFSDSTRIFLEIKDINPPEPPLQISVQNIDGRYISVFYGASISPDVVMYELFRQTGSGPLQSIQRTRNQAFPYRDEAVVVGNTYTYYVSALDAAGNASKPTVSQPITLKDNIPPPIVQNVQSKIDAGTVLLRWEKLITKDVVGYKIYRTSGLPTGVYHLVGETNAETVEWSDTKPPEKGYYHIKAFDLAGNEGIASQIVTGK